MMRLRRFDVEAYVRLERLTLDITGFYPGKYSRKWFVPLIRAIVIFLSLFLCEAMLHFILRNRGNLVNMSRAGMIFIEHFGFIAKCIGLLFNRQTVLIPERILSEDILVNSTEELEEINHLLKPLSSTAKIYQSACASTIVFLAISPLLGKQENGEKAYPLPCAFPFDPGYYYGYIYFGELLSIAIAIWMSTITDNYFVKLLNVGAEHFSILGDKIKNVNKGKAQMNDEEMYHFLRHCVIHQQTVLDSMFVLQKTFSGGIFVQFLCSGVVICLSGFQMLTVQICSVEFLTIISFFSAMIIQLTLYCWYGQFVMEKSDELSDACYETNWYEMNVPNRKMVITIMEGSKKPRIVQAGGFFDLNLRSLMAVLRSSYSYFAILRQVYNKSLTAHART